jgi:aryl-alcohol dehydrogenase-like predicted oxidoreductase
VLPTVYQGEYNLLNREAEESLFPLLRREGIGFVAYSPLASGFLTAKEEKKGNPIVGRLFGGFEGRGGGGEV